METQKDLFGNDVIMDELLRDKFIEPPFSVLDTKQSSWINRKKKWIAKGIKSEVGRNAAGNSSWNDLSINKRQAESSIKIAEHGDGPSIFNPALCEVLYHWFCPDGGEILDPFAGGSVRGIVANYLGYKYTGIDIREEQVQSNREQALDILPLTNQPQWYVGDSNSYLDGFNKKFDFVFSCPPYADLEKYSDLPGDISNMPYEKFKIIYGSIIKKSCDLLKKDSYACFVVGEVRDKYGYYIGLVPDTVRAFEKSGLKFYNECILLNPIASASMRANGHMKSQKLVKVHQNVLVFYKDK